MRNLSNTNPQQPRKSCMQELVIEKKLQKRGKGFCSKNMQIDLSSWKSNVIYKRSIPIEEDQKPKRGNLRGKLHSKRGNLKGKLHLIITN